jgi:hypothetical protein
MDAATNLQNMKNAGSRQVVVLCVRRYAIDGALTQAEQG